MKPFNSRPLLQPDITTKTKLLFSFQEMTENIHEDPLSPCSAFFFFLMCTHLRQDRIRAISSSLCTYKHCEPGLTPHVCHKCQGIQTLREHKYTSAFIESWYANTIRDYLSNTNTQCVPLSYLKWPVIIFHPLVSQQQPPPIMCHVLVETASATKRS